MTLIVEEPLSQRQRHIAAELHPQRILTLGLCDLYTAKLHRVNYSVVYSFSLRWHRLFPKATLL